MPPFQDIFRSLGIHRVLESKGVLAQPAWKLDNTPIVHETETLVDVDALTMNPSTPEYVCTPQQLLDALLKELPEGHPPVLDVASGVMAPPSQEDARKMPQSETIR